MDLSSNGIGSEGAVALSEALKSCTIFKNCTFLKTNSIGSEGAVALSDPLKSYTHWKISPISNGIGSEGTLALGEALATAPSEVGRYWSSRIGPLVFQWHRFRGCSSSQ